MDILTKIIIIAVSVILPGTLYLLFINQGFIDRIRRTPIYLIKELPSQGKVAFIGKAETNTQISPITKKDCVNFNCYVQELKYFGDDHDPHQITIYEDSSKEPLLISDETGSIQVDLNRANIILGPDLQERVTADTNPVIHHHLSELGKNIINNRDSEKSFWVYEEFISAGESIYILGNVRQIDGKYIITNKWNNRVVISDYSKEELLKRYSDLKNQVIRFFPIALIIILLFLIAAIIIFKWSP